MRRIVLGSTVAVALIVVVVSSVIAADGIGKLKIFNPDWSTNRTVETRLKKVEDYLLDNSKAVKTELYRMQREIGANTTALAALPTATPTPSATPSPTPTATPRSSAARWGTVTPTPTATPASDLQTAEVANLWISVVNGRSDRLEVQVLISATSVVVEAFDLDVNLFAGRQHLGELCNTSRGVWRRVVGKSRMLARRRAAH